MCVCICVIVNIDIITIDSKNLFLVMIDIAMSFAAVKKDDYTNYPTLSAGLVWLF